MVAVGPGRNISVEDKRTRPIDIHVNAGSQGRAYIFSHEDVFCVRKKLRILGDFCGTLPKHTAQNQYLSLPLALSYDEASFGIARGFFRPISDAPGDYIEPSNDANKAFFADRNADEKRQIDESVANQIAERERRARKNRKRQREEDDDDVHELVQEQPVQVDQIPAPPPRKVMRISLLSRVSRRIRAAAHALAPAFVAAPGPMQEPEEAEDKSSDGDREEAAQERAREDALKARLRQQARATTLVITATEARQDELRKTVRKPVVLLPPYGVSKERLRSRAAVFADLHDKGYYMSCGAKFGADFLAYAGDPQLFHAALAVIVTRADEEISPLDVIAIGRLGDSTKKRILLAYVEHNKVTYVGVQWEETLP